MREPLRRALMPSRSCILARVLWRIGGITDLQAARRRLHAPAALLLYRQIVIDQKGRELLPLDRGVDSRADEMARWERDAPVSQQRCQAAPVQPVARLPVHSDRHHRIAMVRILRDLIGDDREQQAML